MACEQHKMQFGNERKPMVSFLRVVVVTTKVVVVGISTALAPCPCSHVSVCGGCLQPREAPVRHRVVMVRSTESAARGGTHLTG